MRQRFLRGQRVFVAAEMPDHMRFFVCNCEAIVVGSYADKYGARSDRDFTQYTLLLMGGSSSPNSGCKIREPHWGVYSWYDEGLLTLVPGDRDAGERMLQQWNEDRADNKVPLQEMRTRI